MISDQMIGRSVVAACALTLAACGSSDTGGGAGSPSYPMTTGGTMATAGTSASGAGKGGSGGGNTPAGTKASVRIEKIEPTTMPTAGTTGGAAGGGAAGMMASSAGSGAAAAGSGSAGHSGSGGSSASAGKGGSTGSAGTGGKKSFFDEGEPNVYAAGSGGSGGAGGKGGSGGTSAGTAGAAAGSGGMSAAAGSGAAGATAGSGAKAGSGGAAAPAGPISGTATFTATATGIDLSVMVSGCVAGKMYPIHIHTGSDCADPMGHWDIPRGELMDAKVMCSGNLGTLMYTRKFTDMKPWQIGDMSMADVVGHTLVIHDPDTTTTKIACGKIMKQ